MSKWEISEYNINYDYKDPEHVELLERALQNNERLEIIYYVENGINKIVDGGHTLVAIQKLGLDPKDCCDLIEKTFTSPEDIIAYSRRRNMNRLQQEPIRYTRSLFEELKIRLNITNETELKRTLRTCYNFMVDPERHTGAYKTKEELVNQNNIILILNNIFSSEPIKVTSFIQNHIPYLDFPEWLADMVDYHKLTASQARELNRKEIRERLGEDLQRKIAEQLLIGVSVDRTRKILRDILKLEIRLPITSVVRYVDRGFFGNNEFRGNASGWLLTDLILFYNPKIVYDPMEGFGTSRDVCTIMKDVKYFGEELYTTGFDLVSCSLDKIPENDLTYFHPPYWDIIRYSEAFSEILEKKIEKKENDLSDPNLSYEEFKSKLFKCIRKLLKRTKYLAILIGDVRKSGSYYPIAFEIGNQWKDRLKSVIIKEQHRVTSSGFYYGGAKFIPILHEYVIILKGDRIEKQNLSPR